MRHEIVLNLGRIGRTWGYEPDEKRVCDTDIEMWVSAEALLSNYSYFHDGIEVRLSTSFSSIINWYRCQGQDNYFLSSSAHEEEELSGSWDNNWDGDLLVVVEFLGDGSEDKKINNPNYAKNFVEKYIYDVFIIMNLSVPGSCEFLNLTFKDGEDAYSSKLYLSSYNFEEGYTEYLQGRSIAPTAIPIEKTFAWYKSLNLGVKQKSDSDIDRAIFALLNICKGEMSIVSIVWMFHALEAIYKTRVGEGFTNLARRITFLLDFNSAQEKFLKKELRKLYDLRSSFVHGGYKIHHPMDNEQLDRRIENAKLEEYDACRVGFNLVTLSLQKLITMNWVAIEVHETVVGIPAT